MTPKGQSARDKRLRQQGYSDGYGRQPARTREREYQAAWRRGMNDRNLQDETNDTRWDNFKKAGF